MHIACKSCNATCAAALAVSGTCAGKDNSLSLAPLIKSGSVSFLSDEEQGWPMALSCPHKVRCRSTDITAKCGVSPLLNTIILVL